MVRKTHWIKADELDRIQRAARDAGLPEPHAERSGWGMYAANVIDVWRGRISEADALELITQALEGERDA